MAPPFHLTYQYHLLLLSQNCSILPQTVVPYLNAPVLYLVLLIHLLILLLDRSAHIVVLVGEWLVLRHPRRRLMWLVPTIHVVIRSILRLGVLDRIDSYGREAKIATVVSLQAVILGRWRYLLLRNGWWRRLALE